MTIRKILIAPDKQLKKQSLPVANVNAKIHSLIDDMFETMYASDGLGLAAIQIGEPKRIIVVDIHNINETVKPICLVNPEIIETSEEAIIHEEGCLSLPEQFAAVERPNWVKIRYLNRYGENKEIEANGVLAVCLQHEMDHLDGILLIDHLTTLKRRMILRKLNKGKRIEGSKFGQPSSAHN